MIIRWIGQGGYAITDARGTRYLVDPYLSGSVEKGSSHARLVAPPWPPQDAPADYVLCTHDHLDHTDPEALLQMHSVREFVGPPSSMATLKGRGISAERLRAIERGQTLIVGQAPERGYRGQAQVSAYPAIHTADSVGFLLDMDEWKLYITGDSEFGPELEVLKGLEPDVLFCCINGKWGNMNYEDAATLTMMVRPRLVVPMHYGMFAENTVDPQLFVKALESKAPNARVALLEYNRDYACERVSGQVSLTP